MAGVTRLGDLETGHDACSPTPLMTASDNVFINGRGCGRLSDIYTPHTCRDHGRHSDIIVSASATVLVNGRGIARIGDAVSIGGAVADGSEDVLAGG